MFTGLGLSTYAGQEAVMAGRGPAPKDPSRRARVNADPIPGRVIHARPVPQPELPTLWIEQDGTLVSVDWPERTVSWWRMWAESPLSAEFTSTDWSELMDTAVLHARFWRGQVSLAGELRLRVAKFGATPEDRARLRITFAQADEADAKRPADSASARERFKHLRAVGGSGAVAGS